MPFYVVQHGSALSLATSTGSLTTLTLPSGVTIDSGKRARFAVFNREVLVANSPSEVIAINRDGLVRILAPRPPTGAVQLDANGVGGLSGAYIVKYTNVILDSFGKLLAESGYSPVSAASATLASNLLRAQRIGVSAQTITARRLYRTTSNGSTFFKWIDVDGNVLTTVTDGLSDASLGLVSASDLLGTPPQLALIAEWGNRIWGVSRDDVDTIRFSADGQAYAWKSTNTIPIPPPGQNIRGIIALIPRRDQLGVARTDSLHQITGKTTQTFTRVKVVEGVGCVSQDTVYVHRDLAIFLGLDGVYTWGNEGVQAISDEKTKAWFTTDDYFDRTRFDDAWASFDPSDNTYVLFLTSVGGTLGDRWVKYSLARKTWWGPHKTGAFTPTCAGVVYDADDRSRLLIGSSSGFLWKDRGQTFTDGLATAIDLDVDMIHAADSPDISKFWGQMAWQSKVQAAGSLTVTPKVGDLDASAQNAITVPLTAQRNRTRYLGPGRILQLNLRQNTVAQGAEIYGYEIPFHHIGRR